MAQASSYEHQRKFTVLSDAASVSGRNKHGHVVKVTPCITITATFDGEWDDQARMDNEFCDCICALIRMHERYISSPHQSNFVESPIENIKEAVRSAIDDIVGEAKET